MAVLGTVAVEVFIPVAALIGIAFAVVQWYVVARVAVISDAGGGAGGKGRGSDVLEEDDEEEYGVDRLAVEAIVRRTEETKARVAAEKARMDAVGEKVRQAVVKAGGKFWWEADVEALGEAELPEFARALRRLRDNVQRHGDQLLSSA